MVILIVTTILIITMLYKITYGVLCHISIYMRILLENYWSIHFYI